MTYEKLCRLTYFEMPKNGMTHDKSRRLTDWQCRKCRPLMIPRAMDKSTCKLGVYREKLLAEVHLQTGSAGKCRSLIVSRATDKSTYRLGMYREDLLGEQHLQIGTVQKKLLRGVHLQTGSAGTAGL